MPTGHADRIMPTLRRVVLARRHAARSDGELLGAFVSARDADAFAELVRRHGPMVLGVCRRVAGDRTTAEDAFQAVFLVLARRAAAVRPREQVGNWLYGVAYRTALKARTVLARRRSREKQVDVMPEPTAPAAPPTAWNDLQPVIDEELARLPDKLRLPVVLCDLEGRPQREVAKHLNVPPATLATRLASARRTLATRLTRRGVTLSGGALAGLLGVHAASSAVPPALSAGVVRAVEAVAAGTAVSSLVSATALQLSEGVMRMMMLAKLKAVAATAVALLALTTGLGLGLVPAAAGDDPAPGSVTNGIVVVAKAAPAPQPAGAPQDKEVLDKLAAKLNDPAIDDASFLRRLCLDVRGTPPTPMEMWFFASDTDDDKRAKVVVWMTDDDSVKAHLAKKLGVSPERIRVLRVKAGADGKYGVILSDFDGEGNLDLLVTQAPDGKKLTGHAVGSLHRPDSLWLETLENKNAGVLVDWLDAGEGPRTTKVQRHYTWKRIAAPPGAAGKPGEGESADLFFKVWDLASDLEAPNRLVINEVYADVGANDSDAEFLKRVLADVRGSAPTALELKYFTEDKDPKKREKLIDTLLKDPAVQKKLGDSWKAKMLAPKAAGRPGGNERLFFYVAPDGKSKLVNPKVTPAQLEFEFKVPPPTPPAPPKPPVPPAPQVDKFDKLVGELIAAKKSDEAILESLTLATLGRLPTDSEKKLTLAAIGTAKDRKAAWVGVAKALAGAEKPEGAELRFKLKVEPPKPPVPPAKP